MNQESSILDFKQRCDESGSLVAVESQRDIPFEIKRIFYIFGSNQKTVRGKHANMNSQLLFICVAGTCRIRIDDGKTKKEYLLNRPNMGVLAEKMTWKEMFDFSPRTVTVR